MCVPGAPEAAPQEGVRLTVLSCQTAQPKDPPSGTEPACASLAPRSPATWGVNFRGSVSASPACRWMGRF